MTNDHAQAETIRVLLADDHTLFREGVASLLERTADVQLVGEAATGEEAVRLAGDLLPDVVLMDLQMPGIGGIEATRAIVRHNPHIGVIVLTTLAIRWQRRLASHEGVELAGLYWHFVDIVWIVIFTLVYLIQPS